VPIDKQLLILGAAVAAAGLKNLLIPPARCLDVRDGDRGCGLTNGTLWSVMWRD